MNPFLSKYYTINLDWVSSIILIVKWRWKEKKLAGEFLLHNIAAPLLRTQNEKYLLNSLVTI